MKKNAYARYTGVNEDRVSECDGYFITDDNYNMLRVFTISEVRKREFEMFKSFYVGYMSFMQGCLEENLSTRIDRDLFDADAYKKIIVEIETAFVDTGYEKNSMRNYNEYGGYYFEKE